MVFEYNLTSSVYNFTDLCQQSVDQLQIIKESTLKIPKIAFFVLGFAFLFLLIEYLMLPFFKDRDWYSFFVGKFGWFGTSISFFGLWLLAPFVFKVESQWQMIVPGLFLVSLLLVVSVLMRRKGL